MKSRVELKDRAKEIYHSYKGLAILGFVVSFLIVNNRFSYDMNTNLYTIKTSIFSYTLDNPQNAMTLSLIFMFLTIFIIGPVRIGLKNLYLNLGTDKNTNMSYVLAPYRDGFLRTLWYMILKTIIYIPVIIIGAGLTLLIGVLASVILIVVAGVLIGLSISQADYYFMKDKNMSARECLTQSYIIMSGNKGELFVLYLSFILWYILVAITLGIAGFYVYPYSELTYAAFFKDLNGEEI